MSSMLDATPASSGAASWLAVAGTVGAHALLVLGASYLGVRGADELQKLMPVTEMVEVALPEPPAPPPSPEPERAPVPAPVRAPVAAPAPEPPPPSAAQAGQVLDAKSDVVDFGDTVVTGSGDRYAGGVTDAAGDSKTAVRDTAARGDAGGTGTKPPAAPAVDFSRPPQLAGGSQWQCPFPLEADDAGIDHAVVTLRVSVGADGRVQSVVTSSDPGSGFGREAKRCATSKRWTAGSDREGHPTSAVAVVNVRFDR